MSHTLVYTAISSAGPRLAGISLRPTTGKAFFHDCAHTAGLSWPSREHEAAAADGRKEGTASKHRHNIFKFSEAKGKKRRRRRGHRLTQTLYGHDAAGWSCRRLFINIDDAF